MFRGNNNKSRIYVGNLPENVRERDVEDVFSKFGRIVNLDLKKPRGDKGNCFGFLEFDDPRDAEDAIRSRDGYDFDGCRLRVEFPQLERKEYSSSSSHGGGGGYSGGGYSGGGRGGRGRGRGRGGGGPPRRSDYRILISSLPATGSWQDIKDHLREAGEILYADVFRDGTGIVEFSRRGDMEWAVKNMDDTKFKSHEGETAYIKVKQDGSRGRRSRTRSRTRSRSRSRSRTPPRRKSYSRSPSPR